MEIPSNILEKLKCKECSGYLSSSPVMLKYNGENLCGNCASTLDDNDHTIMTRNTVYEDVASLILFPCAYQKDGCTEKLPIGKIQDHELGCEQRTYCCPMFAINDCPWMGKVNELKPHYEKNHVELMISHPCEFDVDISKNYENYYLLIVFNLLFLLQVKCNKAAAKLWYCVRFIGNPKYAKHFTFTLNIGCSESKIFKRKSVESFETLLLTQSKVLEIDIDTLINVVSGNFAAQIFGLVNIVMSNEKCLTCTKNNLHQLAHLKNSGYICGQCLESVRCAYAINGCTYTDKKINLPKHEHLFCNYARKYCISNYKCAVKEANNWEHLLKHKKIKICDESVEHNLDARIIYGNPLLVLNDTKFIRRMSCTNSILNYKILCDLPKDQTQNYKCSIKWINRVTNYEIEKELVLNLDSIDYDWSIDVHDSENKILYDILAGGAIIKAYSMQTFIKKVG